MALREINLDAVVGPTHHYGGLGIGNLASQRHRGEVANPRAAAHQGLDKMATLHSMGCLQAVLPPQPRPDWQFLTNLGFSKGQGTSVVGELNPELLSAACSASSMWVANAGTVTRCEDQAGRIHITPANLVSSLHRSIESTVTTHLLKQVFPDDQAFAIHEPLPATRQLRDEGAANHMRLSDNEGTRSLEVFVYGGNDSDRFPTRQSKLAQQLIARRHGVLPENLFYLQQSAAAIDAGAFHNDVVATSHENVLMYHELAFAERRTVCQIAERYESLFGQPLIEIMIPSDALSLSKAVACYLFNSQIIRPPDSDVMTIVCPVQCQQQPDAQSVVNMILAGDNPICEVLYVDLRQSMSNGGGPACLRLRVPLDDRQLELMNPSVLWSRDLHEQLRQCIDAFYPETLTWDDLSDDRIMARCERAALQIAQILKIQFQIEASED